MYLKLRSIAIAACLLPVSLLPTTSLAASPLAPAVPTAPTNNSAVYLAQNAYPPELVAIYMDSCVSSASGNDIPSELVQRYCQCSIDTIQSTYTLEQFLAIVQGAAPGQLPSELESIAEVCVSNILS
ncbi:MAG: hypothetical protein HC916_03615 [Coleofasciculaceae cyanobacterium SM2_1_6]|nr:hypothetical protein [Coleofasciculaceae cyanobacterium SM2_1_6]